MKASDQKDPEHYLGMTVNERLFEAGLLDAFDLAAKTRDRGAMITLLQKVFVDRPDDTVDLLIENPSKYGY